MNPECAEAPAAEPTVIRKYANRRLYNTANGKFVTLADLQAMIRHGEEFVVREAKTDRDITVSVLAQIVAEEAGKGNNLMSPEYLRRLLRFYHEGLGDHLSAYLEWSMEVFAANQRDVFRHLSNPFDPAGALATSRDLSKPFDPVGALATFRDLSNPFDPAGALATFRDLGERNAQHFARLFRQGDEGGPDPASEGGRRRREGEVAPGNPEPGTADEIRGLREQLRAIQRRLDAIERGRSG